MKVKDLFEVLNHKQDFEIREISRDSSNTRILAKGNTTTVDYQKLRDIEHKNVHGIYAVDSTLWIYIKSIIRQ